MKKIVWFWLMWLLLTISSFAQTGTSFSVTVSTVGASAIQLQGSVSAGQIISWGVGGYGSGCAPCVAPAHGTITYFNAATGVVVYQPTVGYTGSDSFSYIVYSTPTGGGASTTSAQATVSVTVTAAKTRIVDTLQNPDGTPRQGKITFVLLEAATAPNGGLIPKGSSVTYTLNSSGAFDVQLYPSTGLSPQSAYNLLWQSSNSLVREVLGVYEFPASNNTLTLEPHRVTDANKGARLRLASQAQIDALMAIAASNTIIPINRGGTGAVDAAAARANLGITAGLADPGANGVMVRNAPNTSTSRTITGTAGRVAVSNGNGVSGDPTIDLSASGVTPGSYSNPIVNVDAYGRILTITNGSAPVGGSNATAIQGRAVATTAPSNGQTYLWNSTSSQWEPGAASSAIDPMAWVLSFDNAQGHNVFHGAYWTSGVDLGVFFYEAWVKPLGGAQYIISDGSGGAHALLWGFDGSDGVTNLLKISGNIYDGVSNTSFSSFDGAANGEWVHVAVAWNGTHVITFINGVPSGRVAFAGPRRTPGVGGGGGALFVGGSDHNGFKGYLAQLRGYEGKIPFSTTDTAFVPQQSFTTALYDTAATLYPVYPSIFADYTQPGRVVPDLGIGYNGGQHAGYLHRGAPFGIFNESAAPSLSPLPTWVQDTTAPTASGARPVPTGFSFTQPSVPGGALIFDSFTRANSTRAFSNISLGSTQGGSLGSLAWQYTDANLWGILNARAYQYAQNPTSAYVESGTANHDVRVDRVDETSSVGRTGLTFRFADASNNWQVYSDGAARTSQTIYLVKNVSGVRTQVASAAAPSSWTTLRVTASGTTITVYCDATQVLQQTGQTDNQSATKVGLYLYYGTGSLAMARFDNFTVFGL